MTGSEKLAVIVTIPEFKIKLLEAVLDKVMVGWVISGNANENVKLSLPEYTLPAKSVPDTVAVVEVSDVDTVQVYSHTEADEVADINTLETIPLKLKVGEAAIASENDEVIVTTDEFDTVRVVGLDDRVTVGLTRSVGFA